MCPIQIIFNRIVMTLDNTHKESIQLKAGRLVFVVYSQESGIETHSHYRKNNSFQKDYCSGSLEVHTDDSLIVCL